jgi:hypothetical protein
MPPRSTAASFQVEKLYTPKPKRPSPDVGEDLHFDSGGDLE